MLEEVAMNLGKISDGFVYLAIMNPNIEIHKLYNMYMEYLVRNGVRDEDENFIYALDAGRNARMATPAMKKTLLSGLTYRPQLFGPEATAQNNTIKEEKEDGGSSMAGEPKTNLKELQLGQTQELVALVKSGDIFRAKNGTIYQRLNIIDSAGNKNGCMLFDEPIKNVKLPAVMKLTINIGEYNNSLSYKVVGYEVVPNADKTKYLPEATYDQVKAWNELVRIVKTLRHPLYQITACIVMNAKDALINIPMSNGYRGRGGVLEATLKLVEAAEANAKVYNLDRDLMIAGAVVYNIGRVNMADEFGNVKADDLLIGASALAHEKIVTTRQALILKYSKDETKKDVLNLLRTSQDVRLLEHIVLARYGGIKAAIPEAIVLKNLDTITNELKEISETISDNPEGEILTNNSIYDNRIYNRGFAKTQASVANND